MLAEHKEAVKMEAALMRKAIDTKDLRKVLTHAAQMLEELRTGSLTPKVCLDARLDYLAPPKTLPSPPTRLPPKTPPPPPL